MTATSTITSVRGRGDVDLRVVTRQAPEADSGFVFLHGILQSALSWKAQLGAPALSAWTSVAYDLRGHGFSSKPVGPEHYDGDAFSADLAAILDASGLKRAILVGWSFGGRVILDHLTRDETDPRIAGLVFVDANTKAAPGHVSDECGALLAKTVSPDMAENIAARAAFVDMCFAKVPMPDERSELLAYNCMTAPDVLRGMLGLPLEHDDLMRRLRIPTLVLHGRDDRVSLLACAEHTADTISDAELSIIDGAGHALQLEVPHVVNDALAAFASRVFGPGG